MFYIGIDTSCYTTSMACVGSDGVVCDLRIPLSVRLGDRGLRQSEGLFQHVKNIPVLAAELFALIDDRACVAGVAYSARPCAEDDSYMPVFLAGKAAAASIASSLGVECMETSHQQGHIRAGLFDMPPAESAFLAMHISGGTTDVLLCDAELNVQRIGRSTDLHAGQLVDRVGVALGLSFPSGERLENLASAYSGDVRRIPSAVAGADCSLSGAESALMRLIASGEPHESVAFAVYDLLARTFTKQLLAAAEDSKQSGALIFGGVASSGLLRRLMRERLHKRGVRFDLTFARRELSRDNAVGVALICRDSLGGDC
ncbi:MAG: O-sialoglycoprotein endopeptidase [Clostridia bacterium]|nr:O-sialoglycoprotein endopeptidase [Clostridia bacterium]